MEPQFAIAPVRMATVYVAHHGVHRGDSAERDVQGCGFWCIVPTHANRVVIENVTVDTGGQGPNTDGIEPMWSTDVQVGEWVGVHGLRVRV